MPTIEAARSIRTMSHGTTYAIAWRSNDENESRFVGYLRLEPELLRLEGRGREGVEELRTVAYEDVRQVELRRDNGSRGIALSLGNDEVVLLTSLDRPGSLGELADHLRNLTDSPHA